MTLRAYTTEITVIHTQPSILFTYTTNIIRCVLTVARLLWNNDGLLAGCAFVMLRKSIKIDFGLSVMFLSLHTTRHCSLLHGGSLFLNYFFFSFCIFCLPLLILTDWADRCHLKFLANVGEHKSNWTTFTHRKNLLLCFTKYSKTYLSWAKC